MKKFMFTAIAMVAFMGSSMANTIEENTGKNITGENLYEDFKSCEYLKKTDCVMVANALITLHEYTSAWENAVTWVIIYSNCEATSN